MKTRKCGHGLRRKRNGASHIDVQVLVQAITQDELVGHGHALRLHWVVGTVVIAGVVIWDEGQSQQGAQRGQGLGRAAASWREGCSRSSGPRAGLGLRAELQRPSANVGRPSKGSHERPASSPQQARTHCRRSKRSCSFCLIRCPP